MQPRQPALGDARQAERRPRRLGRDRQDPDTAAHQPLALLLEESLGAKLFDRSPDGYALTTAGRSLVEHAQAMESQARAAIEEIGGNADREYFTAPDTIAQHITEQTCEHCNTYNMLKLTRHLYGWQPDGALFDYYERAHLNHVMSAQDPSTGGFTYMTPLMTGAPREYSTVKDDAFWCCVGSGMESHAKHGESIFWEDDAGGLIVNLYIPADVEKWDLMHLHLQAWEKGIKSLYYLRSKSVQRAGFAGGVEADNTSDAPRIELTAGEQTDYEECLACQ